MTRINTESELNALPEGSVIGITRRGDFTAYAYDPDGWWACTTGGHAWKFDLDHLPATLLYVPGRDLVQEAQANAWDVGYDSGLFDGHSAHTPNPYRDEAP